MCVRRARGRWWRSVEGSELGGEMDVGAGWRRDRFGERIEMEWLPGQVPDGKSECRDTV